MNRDDAFLLDILRFSERAMRATNGRRLEELQSDETLQSALVHPLIVIGEAVKGLSGKFREENTQIPWAQTYLVQNCVFRLVRLFSCLMKASTKAKGKTKEVSLDPIFFAASVPARKPTAKDLKDVKEHENDPIERKDHHTMDDTVEDL